MDLLKKMMGLDGQKDDDDDKRKKKPVVKDEFRKPIWVEEYDSDDDLFDNQKIFGVQIFTNPLEIQKHFEHQIQEMMKSLEEYDDTFKSLDHDLKQDFLKPGFEKEIQKDLKNGKLLDTDLDGEIYPDQLHTLLQRISPDLKELLPKKQLSESNSKNEPKLKLSDEQKIMDWIHGYKESDVIPTIRPRVPRKMPSQRYHDGIFEGTFQGPRMFGQSIISQTIRKPDGTYETRKTVRDSEGHTKTTITRSTKDGKKETITTYGDEGGPEPKPFSENTLPDPGSSNSVASVLLDMNRKHLFSKNGYILPKNLWWLQAQTNRIELTTVLVDHRLNFHYSYTYFPSTWAGAAAHWSLSLFSEPNMCVVVLAKPSSSSECGRPHRTNHCYDTHFHYPTNDHDEQINCIAEQQMMILNPSTAELVRNNAECPVVLCLLLSNLLLAVVIISLSSVHVLVSIYNNHTEEATVQQKRMVEQSSIMSHWHEKALLMGRLWKSANQFNYSPPVHASSDRRRLCLWYTFTLDSYRCVLSNKFAISANNFSWL